MSLELLKRVPFSVIRMAPQPPQPLNVRRGIHTLEDQQIDAEIDPDIDGGGGDEQIDIDRASVFRGQPGVSLYMNPDPLADWRKECLDSIGRRYAVDDDHAPHAGLVPGKKGKYHILDMCFHPRFNPVRVEIQVSFAQDAAVAGWRYGKSVLILPLYNRNFYPDFGGQVLQYFLRRRR